MTLTNNGPRDASDYEQPLDALEAHLAEFRDIELDEETSAALNDLIKDIQANQKDADKSRVALKEPHLTAGRAVDASFKVIIDRAKSLAAEGKSKLTAYLVEQKRIADEARAKAEAEAAEKARIAEQFANDALIADDVKRDAEQASRVVDIKSAEAENAGRAGSLSGLSRTASLRTTYRAEIADAKLAATFFCDHPAVQDAIVKAANAMLRSADNRPEAISGISIIQEHKAA